MMFRKLALSLFVTGSLFVASAVSMVIAENRHTCDHEHCQDRVAVSGSAVHYFDTKIVHRSNETAGGLWEITTETIDLSGDLEGRVLYQPTSNYDFVSGTLVNTGKQVFSGTILDSEPVVIFDDRFRFEVDLNTGVVQGQVFLSNSISGPKMDCEIDVSSSSPQVDGKVESTYAGYCRLQANQ